MSGQTTHTVHIEITDGGTAAKTNKQVEKLHETIKATKNAAARPAKETAAYSKARAATDTPGMERGATGVGGGSGAKDFSRQAQGLGGLVHVYATFAANIFAVSAAFTALSKAADYTNMVAGLDQLGAASGRNLGYLAKELVKATDGAVSLKEAMASVAQASSAGMDNTQIKRLGDLSKKASQALGRDAGDSLNRLTRGIAKIEPELLDELGIFVRVDKAAADYARTIGKTASGLTDYERRQAFANAALDQAQKKFGAIDLPANQFSKLQASFTDLLFKGGEVINKVLNPIMGILASSPLALGTVIAGFTGMLLSKAIPALGQWRKGLVDSAEAAASRANKMKESLQEYKIGKENAQIGIHEENASKYNTQAYNFANDNKLFGKRSKSLYNLAAGDSSTAEAQSKTKLLSIENQIRDVKASQGALNQQDKLIAQQRLALLEVEKKKHLDLLAIIKMETFEKEQANIIEAKGAKGGLDESIRDIQERRAARKAFSSRSLASFSENIEGRGFGGAWEQLNADIRENRDKNNKGTDRLSALGAGALRAKAGIVTLTSAIGTAMSFMGPYIMLIGLAVAAFQLLNSWLSSNVKEQEKFSGAMESASTSVDTLNNTLKNIQDKDPLERLSVDSLLAKANALKGITASIKEVAESYKDVEAAQSAWDKGTNFISGLWGGSNEDKAKKQIASSIASAMKGLPDTPEAQAAKKDLQNLLGIEDVMNKKAIGKVLDPEQFDQVSKILTKLGDEGSRKMNNLKSAFDGLNEASKDYDNIVNGLASSDPFAKMALNSVKAFSTINAQLTTAGDKVAAFREISKDLNKLRLLPEGAAMEIIQLTPQLEKLTQVMSAREDIQSRALTDLNTMNSLYERTPDFDENGNNSDKILAFNLREEAKQAYAEATGAVVKIKADMGKVADSITSSFAKGATEAIVKIDIGVSAAFAKAKIDLSLALLNGSTTPEGIRAEADLKNQQIDLGLRQLDATANLVFSQERLRLAIELQTLELAKNPDQKLISSNKAASAILNSGDTAAVVRKLMSQKGDDNFELLKANLIQVYAATRGADEKRAAAAGEKNKNNLDAKLKTSSEGAKDAAKLIDDQTKLNSEKRKALEISIKSAGIFDRELILQKQAIDEQDELNALSKIGVEYAQKLDNIRIRTEEAIKNNSLKANIGTISADAAKAEKEFKAEDTRIRAGIANSAKTNALEISRGELDLAKLKREESEKYLDLQVRVLGTLEESGSITKSEADAIKFKIEETKRLAKYTEEIRILASNADANNISSIQKQIDQKTKLKDATEAVIQAEHKYKQALQAPIDKMRELERSGNTLGTEYLGAVADDFSNKLTQMIKAAKTAGEVFNDGLIKAIDTSIDELFKAIQTSTLTLKGAIQYARNALSDVFRDAAAQSLKNAWKEAVKGTMLETAADKEAGRVKALQEQLAVDTSSMKASLDTMAKGNHDAIMDKLQGVIDATAGKKVGGKEEKAPSSTENINGMDPSAYSSPAAINEDYDIGVAEYAASVSSSAEDMDKSANYFQDSSWTLSKSADVTKIAADTGKASTEKFGGIISGPFTSLVDKMLDNTGIFGQVVKMLLFNGGSVGGGQGIGGSLVSGAGDLFSSIGSLFGGGGAEASTILSDGLPYLLAAKGGVFDGSKGLSGYSNSVVSSPTMFAFAKGAGVMGEAGPEAIMPLKRDSQGNLGVSGQGVSNTNNISISINISEGQATQGSSSGDLSSTAGQLGNIIKQVVGQELIKQTRPGGLLAR